MIRLLLVEDHHTLRTSLAFILNQRHDMVVASEASSVVEAREKLEGVDLVLLELNLPDGDALALIEEIRIRSSQTRVLLLTGSQDRLAYARAIGKGAAGVIYKSASIDDLVDAILRASAGELIHTHSEIIEFLQLLARQRERDAETEHLLKSLTPRELDLLQTLADGLGDREIANRLNLSIRTVQSHMLNLMNKLGVNSRLQALVIAIRHKIVEILPE